MRFFFMAEQEGFVTFLPSAKIIVSMRSSPHRSTVPRTVAFHFQIPLPRSGKKQITSLRMCFVFWRSRRDLNPRYPFGVHTISSRARYDHFDTAPCGPVSCRLRYITTKLSICQALFFIFFQWYHAGTRCSLINCLNPVLHIEACLFFKTPGM